MEKKNPIAAIIESLAGESRKLVVSSLESGKTQELIDMELKSGDYQSAQDFLAGVVNEMHLQLIEPYLKSKEAQELFPLLSFVSHHLDSLFTQFEGSPCSHDKTRTVIAAVITFYEKGKKIEWDFSREYTYGFPKKILQDHDSIIAFIDALRALWWGDARAYLNCIAVMHGVKVGESDATD